MVGRLALIWTLILAVFAQYEVAQDMMAPDQCGQPHTMITFKNDTLPHNTVFRLERTRLRIDFEAEVFEKLISCLQTDTTGKKCTVESSRVATGKVYEFKVEAVSSPDSEETDVQQGQYYTCRVPYHSDPKEETLCRQTIFNSCPCFTDPMYCIIINLQNTAQGDGKYKDVNIIWISETKEKLTAYYDATYVTIESCQSYTSSPPTTTETTVGNNSMELTSSSEGTNNAGVIAGVICVLIVIAVLVAIVVFMWRRKRKAAGSNSPDLTDTTYDRPQAAVGINSINAYDTVDIGNAYSFQRKISDTPSNVYSLQRRSSDVSYTAYSLQQEVSDTSNNAYSLQKEVSDIPNNAYSLQQEVSDTPNNTYSLQQQVSDNRNNNNVNKNIQSHNREHKQHRKIRPRKNYDNVLPGEFQDSGGEASNTNSQNETAETVNENQSQHEYSRIHENKRNIKNPYDHFLKPSEDLQESQPNPSPTNIVTESSTNQDSEDYSMALTIIDETTNENAEDKNSQNCETNAATDEKNQPQHEYSRLHENKRNITHSYDQLLKPNEESQERQLDPAPTNITRESFSNEISKDYSLAAPFVDETSNEKAEISIIQ